MVFDNFSKARSRSKTRQGGVGGQSHWFRSFSRRAAACLWTSSQRHIWLILSPLVMPSKARDTSLMRLTVSRLMQSANHCRNKPESRDFAACVQLACSLLTDSLSTACPASAGDARTVISGRARHGHCIHTILVKQEEILYA